MTDPIVGFALLGLIGCSLVLWAIAPLIVEEPTYWTTTRR